MSHETQKSGFRKIGSVGVDTATLVIADPCYLHQIVDSFGRLKSDPKSKQLGIEINLGSDGDYAVFGKFDECGFLTEIRIPIDQQAYDAIGGEA